jgi:hypothetical protein
MAAPIDNNLPSALRHGGSTRAEPRTQTGNDAGQDSAAKSATAPATESVSLSQTGIQLNAESGVSNSRIQTPEEAQALATTLAKYLAENGEEALAAQGGQGNADFALLLR